MRLDWTNPARIFRPLVFVILLPIAAWATDHGGEAVFQYAGGSEKIEMDCAGKLEVSTEGLNFKCPAASVDMPFSAISIMQFRPDVSPRVRSLKLKWSNFPSTVLPGKRNQFFTVVFKKQGATHVVVLRVDPISMRPYLAEIELKSGRRVEVMPYEDCS